MEEPLESVDDSAGEQCGEDGGTERDSVEIAPEVSFYPETELRPQFVKGLGAVEFQPIGIE